MRSILLISQQEVVQEAGATRVVGCGFTSVESYCMRSDREADVRVAPAGIIDRKLTDLIVLKEKKIKHIYSKTSCSNDTQSASMVEQRILPMSLREQSIYTLSKSPDHLDIRNV